MHWLLNEIKSIGLILLGIFLLVVTMGATDLMDWISKKLFKS